MNIYVFKTSINSADIYFVNLILEAIIPVGTWSYDMEDCDRILKVKSDKDIVKRVCFHLKVEGFYCEALE